MQLSAEKKLNKTSTDGLIKTPQITFINERLKIKLWIWFFNGPSNFLTILMTSWCMQERVKQLVVVKIRRWFLLITIPFTYRHSWKLMLKQTR